MSLLNKSVQFQTDVTSWGEGVVVEELPGSDLVVIVDSDGETWRGPLDLVTPVLD